jgi:glutathione synthase/RimK-type ligase-like ATP-grasp enzyme
VGDPQDLSLVYVGWLAQRRGIQVTELREDALGIDWTFAFTDTDLRTGYIERANVRYPFSELCGAFVRFNPQPAPPPDLDLALDEQSALIVERRNAIQYLLNFLPFTVANRPCSGRSNASKPYQMHLLARAGFTVPKWITSNEETRVADFVRACPDGAIYKSCSGIRSHVRMLDEQLFERLRDGTSPTIIQEYVKGQDVRIHVVKQRVFPTKILSSGIDYRFESESNKFEPTSAPKQIEDLCCRVAEAEGLTIAGFDFRVTGDGQWYCLEVNPVPTFLPYEMETSQPIGGALLDLFVATRSKLGHSRVV